ncbi:gamma-glutamylcyclotransferase family protein [Thiohalorhabdus sp.]|uniref:gamma-glutamylcyclotransferase family protein n=1 Tax=Thiohalorhabdus sp. TaxID=3094134 RepID=UPI002FC3938C
MAVGGAVIRVFVYGTLKPGQANWERALRGHVRRWRAAVIRGRLFDLATGFPAATAGNGRVHGYALHLPAEKLAVVDAIEGFEPGRNPGRNLYQRLTVFAFTPQGAPMGKVYAYFMDAEGRDRLGGTELPEGIWRPLVRSKDRAEPIG